MPDREITGEPINDAIARYQRSSRGRNTDTDVYLHVVPGCDYCADGKTPAAVDGKTRAGYWANMCEYHYFMHGLGLGLGRGQRLHKDVTPA